MKRRRWNRKTPNWNGRLKNSKNWKRDRPSAP
nr:MAG TPA: hypothetical protein [Caudoviricetes sp.]